MRSASVSRQVQPDMFHSSKRTSVFRAKATVVRSSNQQKHTDSNAQKANHAKKRSLELVKASIE